MLLDLRTIESSLDRLEAFSFPPIYASPTVLVSCPAVRRQLNEALASSQQEVDEALSVLPKIEERVALLRQQLQHRSATLTNLAAPVSGLPVELLRDIFLMYAAETTTSKSSIVLSHVSAQWRAVSINLPELWTVIQLRPDRPNGIFDSFLRRSANLRVHISPLWRNLNQFDFELDPKIAPRVSSISNMDNLTKQSAASWGHCAKYLDLDNLGIGSGERFPPAYHHQNEDLHTRSLRLIGHTVADGKVPLKRLTHLEIADVSQQVFFDTTRAIGMPNLEVLELCGIQYDHGPPGTGQGLSPYFRRLRRIVLASCHERAVEKILYHCTMPTLSTACIDLTMCQTTGNLRTFLRNSPKLNQLALTIPAYNSSALYSVLRNEAPALRDLKVILAAHSLPRSAVTFSDTSSALREALQLRLESPDLTPIESLTLSEHLVGAEVDWLIQNTALTRVPSDDIWSIGTE